jgi:hypothetical protein
MLFIPRQSFWIIALIFLVACDPVTPILPNPISTPTFTSVVSTATNIPTETLVPITTPTATGTPYVMPDAPTPDSAKTYIFHTPDPEKLVNLAFLNLEANRTNYSTELQEDLVSQANSDEWGAIDNLIAADLRRYFPTGVPDAEQFARTTNDDFADIYFLPSTSRLELLLTGILQYLNVERIQFLDGEKQSFPAFELTPHSIDLDGDGEAEWIVEIIYPSYNALFLRLPLRVNPDGKYVVIPNSFSPKWLFNNADTSLVLGHDVTGDGKMDVLVSYTDYFGGTISGDVSLYTWQNKGLYSLDSVRLRGVTPRFGEAHQSEFAIADYDKDGHEEIRVTWPRFRPFGCAWETQSFYHWNGGKRVEKEINVDTPDQPNCYIAKGLESEDPVEQARWFESARKQLAPLSSDFQAFLALRLSVAYAAQGRDQDAQKELEALDQIKETGSYLGIVRSTSRKLNFDALSVCKELYFEAGKLDDSSQTFNSTIDDDLAFFYGYPLSFTPDPTTVCPYWELVKNRLAIESIPGIGDPVTDFAAKGYSLSQVQPLLNQAKSWVGIIDIECPLLVMLRFHSDHWTIEPIQFLDSLPAQIETGLYRSPNNGPQKLLIFLTLPDSDQNQSNWYTCNAGQKEYQLMLASYDKGKYKFEGQRTYRCQNKPPTNLATESGKAKFIELVNECDNCDLSNDQRTGPTWQWLEGFPDNPLGAENVFEYIDKLEKQIIQGDQLEKTLQRIETLIAFLPADDPAVIIINRRLRYMLGLSYELQKMPNKAIPIYLSVIQETPNSLWSWLAWTRFEIK